MEDLKLDKAQLVELEKRLKEWQETNKIIEDFEEDSPLIDIQFVKNHETLTLSVASIENNRPNTQFGRMQRAHTLAYSAVLKSLTLSFQNLNLILLKDKLLEFHRELNMTYVTSITSDPIKFNGRKAVFGQRDLHDLKELADKIVSELFAQKEEDLFTTVPVLLKLYLSTFLYMNNRFVDATVDIDSKGWGEGSALQGLENLGNSLRMDLGAKDDALKYMSLLIDEEAIEAALRSSDRENKSLIAFQILGIYRLLSAYPNLSQLLSLDGMFLKRGYHDSNLFNCLGHIIFQKTNHVKPSVIYNSTENEIQLFKNALEWLQDAYRINSLYGTLATIH